MPIRRVQRLSLAAILIAGTILPAAAQSSSQALTLGEALARAQQHAPAILAAEANLRAADAGIEVAGLLPNPTITVEAENVLGSGRYAGFGGAEKTYALSMPLELGGKRAARVQLARAERAYAGASADLTKTDVALRTTLAFIALAASERRLAAAQTGRDLAERAAFAARERVRTGKASPIEEQRAEVLRVNAGVKATQAARAVDTAAAVLARLAGVASPPAIAAPWFDSTGTGPAREQLAQSLPLVVADAQVAAAQARVHSAQRARIPDVNLSVGTRRYGETGDSAAVFSLSVPLPLFNRSGAEIARARAELDKVQAERAGVKADIDLALGAAQGALADACAAAEAAAGPALAAAGEAARIARIGYAEGKFTQLELLEAERSLAETREAAINALAAYHEAHARVAQLQGSTAPIYKD